MCQQCVDALKQYWPDLPESQWWTLLFGGTCFPFGSGEQTAAQLRELAEKSGCDMERALAIADSEIPVT